MGKKKSNYVLFKDICERDVVKRLVQVERIRNLNIDFPKIMKFDIFQSIIIWFILLIPIILITYTTHN